MSDLVRLWESEAMIIAEKTDSTVNESGNQESMNGLATSAVLGIRGVIMKKPGADQFDS